MFVLWSIWSSTENQYSIIEHCSTCEFCFTRTFLTLTMLPHNPYSPPPCPPSKNLRWTRAMPHVISNSKLFVWNSCSLNYQVKDLSQIWFGWLLMKCQARVIITQNEFPQFKIFHNIVWQCRIFQAVNKDLEKTYYDTNCWK